MMCSMNSCGELYPPAWAQRSTRWLSSFFSLMLPLNITLLVWGGLRGPPQAEGLPHSQDCLPHRMAQCPGTSLQPGQRRAHLGDHRLVLPERRLRQKLLEAGAPAAAVARHLVKQ